MGILLNWWARLPRSRRKVLWDCHAARRCRSLAQGNSSPFFNNLCSLLKLGKSHKTQRPYMVTEMPLKLDRFLEADLNNYKTLCLDNLKPNFLRGFVTATLGIQSSKFKVVCSQKSNFSFFDYLFTHNSFVYRSLARSKVNEDLGSCKIFVCANF